MGKNIRALEDMPLDIRFLYGKILGCMVAVDRSYNQLKLAAFYRIISKIRLPAKKRIQLINTIVRNKMKFFHLYDEIKLDQYLNHQEVNIFRFSLMKDLINIMKADYIETDGERELLEEIKNYFNISPEQFVFFIEEYQADRNFFQDNMTNRQFRSIVENTVSTSMALGIPLLALYYSGTSKQKYILKRLSTLYPSQPSRKILGLKRKKARSSPVLDLGKYIFLAITVYKASRYILSLGRDEKTRLLELVREDIGALHENTKDTIYYDIEYFNNRIAEFRDRKSYDLLHILKVVDLLERAAATLERTGPVIL